MKKLMYVILLALIAVGLSACGNKDTATDLQSQKWNVVSTNGESYTGEFGENTVTFNLGVYNRGFNYTLKDNEISLVEGDAEPIIFAVEKNDDEYIFKPKSDEDAEVFGDLTLSPSKD